MDFDRYRYHLILMDYRESLPSARLSALRHDIHQPMGTLCGMAQLLQVYLAKSELKPKTVQELQVTLQSICTTLRDLHEKTRLDHETLTDELAQEALLAYWNKREVVNTALALPDRIRQIEDDLRVVLPPDAEHLLESVPDRVFLLQAEFDILANPDELNIPLYVVEAYKLLKELRKTPGDPVILPKLIAASKHPFHGVRETVATLLQHYQNEDALNTLVELLKDEAEPIRGWAANSLGHLKNRKAIPALLDCLQQNFKDEVYREWIIWALTEIPDERSLDTLIAALDQFMVERQQAQNTLPLVDLKIERMRTAIQAIGGAKAEQALKRYFK